MAGTEISSLFDKWSLTPYLLSFYSDPINSTALTNRKIGLAPKFIVAAAIP